MTRFSTVLADPPWKFSDTGSRMAPGHSGTGRAYKHYDVVPNSHLMGYTAYCMQNLADDDALLFLWCPNALVLDGSATAVARAWGFEPKQLIPWLKTTKTLCPECGRGKPRIGGGHYTRVCTEQLILCRRGKPEILSRAIPGFIDAPRGVHSAKPDESYELIQKLTPGPYLEVYARRQYNDQWTALGNEMRAKQDKS